MQNVAQSIVFPMKPCSFDFNDRSAVLHDNVKPPHLQKEAAYPHIQKCIFEQF